MTRKKTARTDPYGDYIAANHTFKNMSREDFQRYMEDRPQRSLELNPHQKVTLDYFMMAKPDLIRWAKQEDYDFSSVVLTKHLNQTLTLIQAISTKQVIMEYPDFSIENLERDDVVETRSRQLCDLVETALECGVSLVEPIAHMNTTAAHLIMGWAWDSPSSTHHLFAALADHIIDQEGFPINDKGQNFLHVVRNPHMAQRLIERATSKECEQRDQGGISGYEALSRQRHLQSIGAELEYRQLKALHTPQPVNEKGARRL